jgi:signal transduction histidine kinase
MGGRGLIGMQQRVAMFGGSLEAGPSGAGFQVRARLPLDAPAVPT